MDTITSLIHNNPKLKNFAASINQMRLKTEDQKLIADLIQDGQLHLFENWEEAGVHQAEKETLLNTLGQVHKHYPSGLIGYIRNARERLYEAHKGVNSFEGYTPTQPEVIDMSQFHADYLEAEDIGLAHLNQLAIVMVAGGLGERLGYAGIKVNIAVESVLKMSYLEYYARNILAMQRRVSDHHRMPFIIMTSDQTHDKTLQALESHNWFGLEKEQVHLITQKLVPAVSNNQGHLALEGPYQLALKPHGHGDIHMLLHSSGLAQKLAHSGFEYLLFIQDTNGQVFNAALSAVGVSIKHGFDFNSLAVKRIPKEAVGALAKLTKPGVPAKTLNIEYNLLDPLLRATVNADGDVADESGYSPFPGNINVLILKLSSYLKVLEKTEGIIAEFINPKYNDQERLTFKSPTRLETMMQDLPKLYGSKERVGVTIYARNWCFSTNKNNLIEARKKYESGGPAESAITAESDFYESGRVKLAFAGCKLRTSPQTLIAGIPYIKGPRVYLDPSFALTLKEVRQKIKNVTLSGEATLYLSGSQIELENVIITDGSTLMINATSDAHVIVKNLNIKNSGHKIELLDQSSLEMSSIDESDRLRTFVIYSESDLSFNFDQKGVFSIDNNGKARPL